VLKVGEGFALEQELADGRGGSEMAGDDLDGDGLLEVFGYTLTEVDDTHAAAAEDVFNVEGAEETT
jgi:hypothetical protein